MPQIFELAENAKFSRYHFQEPVRGVIDTGNPRRDWQFRISIKPTRENLLKALDALRSVPQFLIDAHPPIKIFLPDENNDLSDWDGVLPGNRDKDSDREPRYKELCVYMDYDSENHKYAFSVEYHKDLMLTLWRSLEVAGVELNYGTPSRDERVVPSEPGIIPPIHYSSFKSYDQRHGIMQAEHYNEFNFPDPLTGVSISHADLQQYSIKGYHPLEVHVKRLVYQQQHFQENSNKIKEYFEYFRDHLPQFSYETFEEVFESIDWENPESVLAAGKAFLTSYLKVIPYEARSKLSILYNQSQIGSLVSSKNIVALKIVLQRIRELAKEEMTLLLKDWQLLQKNLPEIFGTDFTPLQNTILHYPREMQSRYRMSVHLLNEKQKIELEKKHRIECFNYWFGTGDHYDELNQLDPVTRMRIVKSLVDNLEAREFLNISYRLSLICYRHKNKEFIRNGAVDFLGDLITEYIKKHDGKTLAAFKKILYKLSDDAIEQCNIPILQFSEKSKALFDAIYEATKSFQDKQTDGVDYVKPLASSIFIKSIVPQLIQVVQPQYDSQTRAFKGHEKSKWHTLGVKGKQDNLTHLSALFRDYHTKAHWYYFHSGRKHELQAKQLAIFIQTADSAEAAYLKLKEYYEQAKTNAISDPKHWNLKGSYIRRLKYALLVCETALSSDQIILGRKCQILSKNGHADNSYLTQWFQSNCPAKVKKESEKVRGELSLQLRS